MKKWEISFQESDSTLYYSHFFVTLSKLLLSLWRVIARQHLL
jgi:hypothetical protein